MSRATARAAVAALLLTAACAATAAAAESIPAPSDLAAPPADAERTGSGLITRVLEPGDGEEHPAADAEVVLQYTGWTADGEMFYSSVTRGLAERLPLDVVLDGLNEGVQLMVEGEKRRFWIPESLAYKGQEGKPAGQLVFDVELVRIHRSPTVPEDVAAPPADAEVSRSGLASKVLTPGDGTLHPNRRSTVTVHYSGWTTDGEMFDSSVERGQPSTFRLDQVIRGWTEGLALMVEGETRRLWIPEKLAYRGQRGKPKGMLVFDVELIDIQN